jgi:Uma2 family endonuclease
MQDAVSASGPVITYPERDGKPMGETDVHRREIINAIETLSDYFRNDPQVYVAGDLMLYYEEGNPKAVVVSDVFVVRGVEKRKRRIYKLWEEGKPPQVVIEVTSRSSRLDDLGSKRALYAMLGVTEYYIFDPLGEYLDPKLQGFRLHEGDPQRFACVPQEVISSEVLGLRLEVDGNQLRLVDP